MNEKKYISKNSMPEISEEAKKEMEKRKKNLIKSKI
jgi:hypothetical protein